MELERLPETARALGYAAWRLPLPPREQKILLGHETLEVGAGQ